MHSPNVKPHTVSHFIT